MSGDDEVLDLICVGFGPASLAIAIALSEYPINKRPNALFLERQSSFAWHAGMQLPGAKMQISFLKDLATPRNPRSRYTFVNYLHEKGRFHDFVNLSTFTPSRLEFEDYLRWCAGHIESEGRVGYGMEVVDVVPQHARSGIVNSFIVRARDVKNGKMVERVARHVVIAVGGKGNLPKELPQTHAKVIHSSQYSMRVASALPESTAKYHIAVIGNGQSAAEIFNDLPSRYPNSNVTLIIKGSALRPSDDSPFVNEVFNPDRVDNIFRQNAEVRGEGIRSDRATNYGVVRIDLLDHLFEKLYFQQLKTPNKADWKFQIRNNRRVIATEEEADGKLRLRLEKLVDDGTNEIGGEQISYDAVFVATGYLRNAHEAMLKQTRSLLPKAFQAEGSSMPVGRDYRVGFDQSKVSANAGVWLQGCNESTHGVSFVILIGSLLLMTWGKLSDTLLSILAIRGGELVESIFGGDAAISSIRARL